MCLALRASGLWLRYAAKFDPFLSLDCARVEGSNFAIWQPCSKGLGHVLDFVYKGSISLAQDELIDFLAVAVSLQIPLAERSTTGSAKGALVPNKSEKSKRVKVPRVVLPRILSKDDGVEMALPESVLSKLPTGIVIKPCPGTSAPEEGMDKAGVNTGPDENLYDVNMNQDDYKEGNPDKATDGALKSLQALIAENTRPTDAAGGCFCNICDKVLGKGRVKSHFEDLHWSEAPTYCCPAPKCQVPYTSKGAFRKHLSRNHPDWKGVPLEAFLQSAEEPIAGSSNGAPTSLEALIAENSWPTDGGGCFCKFCLKVLGKGRVKSHFEDLHWSEAPSYHCPAPECQKVYTSKGAFKKHLSRNHPDLKGVPLETLRNDGLEQGLPEIYLSTLPTGNVIKPDPGTFAPDEDMYEGSADQDSFIEGNPDEAVEKPIAGTSEGAPTSLQALIDENTRPTDDDGHFCIICDKVMGKGSIRRHFEDRHWSEAPSYYCPAPKCQKEYTSKSAFKMHLRTKHPDWKGVPLETFLPGKEETIEGTSDGAPTSLEALIAKNARPTGAGGHFCMICTKVLGKGSVRRHFEDRHWSEAPSYHCPAPECQKEYTSKSAFKMHLRTKHPDLKGVPLESLRNVD